MIRFALVALVVAAALWGVREHRLLEDAGLFGSCTAVETTAPSESRSESQSESQWLACRPGRLTDAPDLTRDACVHTGTQLDVAYWRCPAPLVASRAGSEDAAG